MQTQSRQNYGERIASLTTEVAGFGHRLDDHILNVKDRFSEVTGGIAELKADSHRDNDEIKQQVASLSGTFATTVKDLLTHYATKEQVDTLQSARDKEIGKIQEELAEVKRQSQETHDQVIKWAGGLAVLTVVIGIASTLAIHFWGRG